MDIIIFLGLQTQVLLEKNMPKVPNQSWDQGLSAEVSFVSVLAMVLSQSWSQQDSRFVWRTL